MNQEKHIDMNDAKRALENEQKIIKILRTHGYTDEDCIDKICEILGIKTKNVEPE